MPSGNSAGGARRLSVWAKVLIGLGLLSLPCLLALVVGAWWFFRKVEHVEDRALSSEARVNVLQLCSNASAYRDEVGSFLPAGPQPREVPRGGKAVPFPRDEAFLKLGFEPESQVRYQYEVVVQENPVGEPEVTCLARGDLDGDGVLSVFSVTLDANGMTSLVKAEREDE